MIIFLALREFIESSSAQMQIFFCIFFIFEFSIGAFFAFLDVFDAKKNLIPENISNFCNFWFLKVFFFIYFRLVANFFLSARCHCYFGVVS